MTLTCTDFNRLWGHTALNVTNKFVSHLSSHLDAVEDFFRLTGGGYAGVNCQRFTDSRSVRIVKALT